MLSHFSRVRLCVTHRRQPTRLCRPWDSLGKNTGVGCHFLLQCKWKWKVKVKLLSHVWLLATPWTAAYQAPPSMGFSRQEYWSSPRCLQKHTRKILLQGKLRQPTGQGTHSWAKGRRSCWGCPAVLGVPCWTKNVQECHMCVTPSSGYSLPSKRQAPLGVSSLSLTITGRDCTEILQQGHGHWCPVIKHRFLDKSFITIIFKYINNKCWRGCREKEPSYTVGGNVNWYSHYGKQYGGSLKNQKCSFHMI